MMEFLMKKAGSLWSWTLTDETPTREMATYRRQRLDVKVKDKAE
jgi:hypothetical protein